VLTQIPTKNIEIASYVPEAGEELMEEMVAAAEPLDGARVLHINSTAFGGGVAEILPSLIPLQIASGLDSQWQTIRGTDEFFKTTKRIHNSLQGSYVAWTEADTENWLSTARQNAELFEGEYDFVVVHDPQPAPLLAALTELHGERPPGHWLWRCHIDLTDAQPEMWDRLWSYVKHYDGMIVTSQTFVPESVRDVPVAFIAPAIDPLSAKNHPIALETAAQILTDYGIDVTRPLIVQVSRFDPWKDPLGVVDVYRELKLTRPEVQLLYVASMAADDPEGWTYYERTLRRAGEDPDVHVLTNLQNVGNTEVNAAQSLATVVVQKSIREGFGLSVTEAMWKGRPVVATQVGGIGLQVIDGETGLIAASNADFVSAIDRLLDDAALREQLGTAGREHVRKNFLMPRNARDHARMYRDVRDRVGLFARTEEVEPA